MPESHESGSNFSRRLRLAGPLGRLVGVLVLAMSLVGGWLLMDYRAFVDQPLVLPGGTATHYAVPQGASLKRVAQDLAQQDILTHPRYFEWYARWNDLTAIKAGEYALLPGMTAPQLLDHFVSGKVVQHSLTLVEGWTFRQAMEAITRHEALDHRLAGLAEDEIMARIGHPGERPEGRFLPDTYFFPRGTTDISFLQRAYAALLQTLDKEWEGRAEGLPFKSPYEALVLASIVEKETADPTERLEIAGVFVRRLRLGMRLQTDPTVIYGLGDSFDGDLRRADLIRDTPYNTYMRAGLPPTPVAMPGAASIHAVMHPADSPFLYFVARGDGSHHFSTTLEEHNSAVVKYQLRKQPGRPGQGRPFDAETEPGADSPQASTVPSKQAADQP